MKTVDLFKSTFGYEYLNLDNAKLEAYCYNLERLSKAQNKETGWQSGSLDLTDVELEPLLSKIKECIIEYVKLLSIKKEHTPVITNGWININKPDGRSLQNNVMHLHPGRFLSFVYYVKAVPKSGDLTLYSPIHDVLDYAIPVNIYEENNPSNGIKWIVPPETGKLIMFPGWVNHRAGSNSSFKDRISIAFNTELQNINHG